MTDTPPRDYSLAELQRLTKYSSRMIGRYIQMGLVPAPQGKGSRARYSRAALGRLLCIANLRRGEERFGTPDVKAALEDIPDASVEAWAEEGDPLAPAVDSPPPIPRATVPPEVVPPVAIEASAIAVAKDSPAGASQRWTRVSLLPGLELMVREGSGELVARLADEIVAKYGTSARG